jgi:hypothetical protein
MGDLFRRPAQPCGQLRRVEPGLTHRAVEFELGGGQGGEPRHWGPVRRRRSRNLLIVGDHPEDRFLEHILGLTQRLFQGRAVADVGGGHREATLRLGFEEGGINMRHVTSFAVVPAFAGTTETFVR